MRLQNLQIPTFGPFTNFELTFPDQPVDLHIVYGANEAGKSSLLRAIRDLLFGIHGQSPDNFLHDYSTLRIRGEMGNRAGDRLIFQRRKGNKNTLLDAEGKQLPDNALFPYLGSVDLSYFSTMFGLGARELQEGAQQLLRGEGDMGSALFSASLGGTPVQKVVEALQQEAERLFKGRATANVSIRPTTARYKELLRQSREAMVNPEAWDTIEQDLAKAEAEKKHFEDDIALRQRELAWIERCEDALPTVGRLSEEMDKLAQLPPLPQLASDFIARASRAREAVVQAQDQVQRLIGHIGKLRSQLENCKTAPTTLAEADVLDRLHQDFSVYRDRKKTAADLELKLAGLGPLIRAGMQNLELTGDFTSLDSHRFSTPVQLACEEAAKAVQKGLQELSTNVHQAESFQSQVIEKELALGAVPETNLDELREALAVAAEAMDADRTLAASETEVQRLNRETVDRHRLVVGAPKDFEATAQMTVPTLGAIRGYHEKIEGIKREIVAEEKETKTTQKRGDSLQAELARLQRKGELPTEEALRNARTRRDHGWCLVLAEWKGRGSEEVLIPGSSLEEAFPQTITKADEIADKLRLDAEAVAQAEEKRFQLGEMAKQVGDTGRRIQILQGDLAKYHDSWVGEWSECGIIPRPPREMEEWRTQWSEFRGLLGQLKSAEESLQNKRNQIQRAQRRLAAILGQPEEKEYSLLFAAARKRVQDGEQAAGRRIEIANQLKGLKNELAKQIQNRSQLETAVKASSEKWKSQCLIANLPADTSPEAGLTLLQERKALWLRFDEWRESSSRSQLIIEAIAQYEKCVHKKAVILGIKGDTIDVIEASLWRGLTEARKSQERHDQLTEQIYGANSELEEAQRRAGQAEQVLGDLVHLAGLASVADLEPMLAHLEKRDAVRIQIDELRKTLSGLARGQGVDDFVSKVRAEVVDSLGERKSVAAHLQLEMETGLTRIRETVFRLTNEKQKLETAGDAAGDFRQRAESCAATLRQDAGRYLRLCLATHLLKNQIEQFRKENQGPLLQKSGEIFQATTRGAFGGLGADFSADDVPILVGVRPDQSKVPVEGLSDGSRDQLYLALRLAALDRYLEVHEPMPFILDDLLITFDDDRAQAILPQLADLAQRTQIFLFTHHEHLVELCRRTLGEGQFHIHRLTTVHSNRRNE